MRFRKVDGQQTLTLHRKTYDAEIFWRNPGAMWFYLYVLDRLELGDNPVIGEIVRGWATDPRWYDELTEAGALSLNGRFQDVHPTIDGRACILGPSQDVKQQQRRALGQRRRFCVLERDQFRCVYCGATADDAKLAVDHVIPVARGGSDDMSNLVTACFDCNIGKSDHLIGGG
jgi:hypothetical protein